MYESLLDPSGKEAATAVSPEETAPWGSGPQLPEVGRGPGHQNGDLQNTPTPTASPTLVLPEQPCEPETPLPGRPTALVCPAASGLVKFG